MMRHPMTPGMKKSTRGVKPRLSRCKAICNVALNMRVMKSLGRIIKEVILKSILTVATGATISG